VTTTKTLRFLRVLGCLCGLFLTLNCSKSSVIPSEPTKIQISLSSDGNAKSFEIVHSQVIKNLVQVINQSTATPRKFRTKLRMELFCKDQSYLITVNGNCIQKEGISYCSDVDIENLVMESVLPSSR